jgi:prepilin signal peptidase PulO-like enzyme (type II secretory pathway)
VLATRGVSARKDAMPFGPFLALGGILAYFLG